MVDDCQIGFTRARPHPRSDPTNYPPQPSTLHTFVWIQLLTIYSVSYGRALRNV
jgi:hypothetical protein